MKHGDSKARLYRTWRHIRQRTSNPNHYNYAYYGGRGIAVCKEWENDYLAFKKWAIKNGYSDDLTLDRINNDGNYCPENCRWATHKQQCSNERNNRFVVVNGVRMVMADWLKLMNTMPNGFHVTLG